MTKFLYILLINLIGFLLMPTIGMACKKESKPIHQTVCKTQECCKKEDNKHKSCHGDCQNKDCHCSTVYTYFVANSIELNTTVEVNFHSPTFQYTESYFTTALLSVWHPPKIFV